MGKRSLCSHQSDVHYATTSSLTGPLKPFILSTDASTYALGAVVAQEHEDRKYPVAYASRVLSPAERNYSVVEKELLAIVFAI